MSAFKEKITIAITGASGSLYALRLIECLVSADYQLYILCSSAFFSLLFQKRNCFQIFVFLVHSISVCSVTMNMVIVRSE